MTNGGGLLPIIALLPFLGALIPGIMIRAGRNACAAFTAVPTIVALAMLATMTPQVMAGADGQDDRARLMSLSGRSFGGSSTAQSIRTNVADH